MKKALILASVLIILLSLSGCDQSDQGLTLALDSDGIYTGFSDLPSEYTAEQAEKDGCYVKAQFESVGGQGKWDKFVEQAAKGNDGSVTILTDDNSLTYKDVMWTFLSNNSRYAETISSFELIFLE